jgi:flagellar biosynthesis protein
MPKPTKPPADIVIDTGTDPRQQQNLEKIPENQIAIALEDRTASGAAPKIIASGRGAVAQKILDLATQHNIKVRKDADLAEILRTIEVDSPIPTEAFLAVAEILSYIYRANGQDDPFGAIFNRFTAAIQDD